MNRQTVYASERKIMEGEDIELFITLVPKVLK